MNLVELNLSRCIAVSVLSDINFLPMLSDGTVKILRCPCDEREILRRQSIFSSLDRPDFAALFTECRSELVRLSKLVELYRQSRERCERLFLRCQVLEGMLASCHALELLRGHSFAIDELLCDPIFADMTDVRAELDAIYAVRAPIESFVLSLGYKWFLSKDYDSRPYIDELRRMAISLGLDVPERSRMVTSLSDGLWQGYGEMFADELSQIEERLSHLEHLNADALTDLIYQMDFFLEIKDLIGRAAAHDIPSCLPRIAKTRRIVIGSAYDCTLLQKEGTTIVPNDVDFTEDAPFFFLTGANGGGKTTYLRTVAVNLIMFMAGCPIFARSGEIYTFSGIQTHFPADERFTGVGRFDEELLRVSAMLEGADRDQVLLFNETFSGTDEKKGMGKTAELAETMAKRGMFGLFVTHFHDISSLGYPILQAVVISEGGKDNMRTFKIIRDDKKGSSYAQDILKKYGLDAYSLAKRRIDNNA